MSTFIPLDEVAAGGQSVHYPQLLADMYVVKEFIGRAGKVKNDEIRVGYVDLKPGADYPVHSHPAPEVYIQIEGEVAWTVGDEKKVVNTMTAISIPPKTSHAMRNLAKHSAKLIYFWYAPGGDISVLKSDAFLDETT